MIIQEKIKAMASDDAQLSALINTKFFSEEAPQGCTIPFVVLVTSENLLPIHNTNVPSTREWDLSFYAYGASPLLAHQLAVHLKRIYALYKESEPGASDTDIDSITIKTGIQHWARTAETKAFPCSLVLTVMEHLT